jgi:DNA-binding response OmpR family regulator
VSIRSIRFSFLEKDRRRGRGCAGPDVYYFSVLSIRRKRHPMSKRILIVDDDPDSRTILTCILESDGYEVGVANDGFEALREIGDHPPDLVLLDVMMPGKNGFEVCESVKSNPKMSHITIIMISAKSDPISQEKALSLGASDYLTKPINPSEVLRRVIKFL